MKTSLKEKFASKYMRILFILFIFIAMVGSGYTFINKIEQKYLEEESEKSLDYAATKIQADLKEQEIALGIISETVRDMIIQGNSLKKITKYLTSITKYENTSIDYQNIHAYFDNYEEKIYSGSGKNNHSNKPEESPWYKIAFEANGAIGITEPYNTQDSLESIITFTRRIFDNQGHSLGIINLDFKLSQIEKYATNIPIIEGSYGIMTNKNFQIIAHPDSKYLGKHLEQLNSGISIENDLRWFKKISGREVVNFRGEKSIAFIRELENGWWLGVLTPKDMFYKNIIYSAWLFYVLCAVIAIFFGIILSRITKSKNESDESIQSVFDATPICTSFWNKNLKIVDCNKEALKLFELSTKKEFVDNFFNFSPKYQPDGKFSTEKFEEAIKKTFEKGYNRTGWMHKKLNGELIPSEIIFLKVKYKKDYLIAVYLRDLRGIQTMVAQVHESNQLLKTMENILNSIDTMIYVTVPFTDEIIFINDLMKKNYGIKGDVRGQACYKILNKFNKRCDFCPCHKLDKAPRNIIVWEESNPLTKRKYRNSDRYIEWTNGKIVHIQYSVDVTELVNAKEDAEQNSRFKSRFLSHMSHEIRTPMNTIMGVTEWQLHNDKLTQKTRESFREIYNSGNLLLNIINDILDLSKIEAGKMELNLVEYEIESLINDSIQFNKIYTKNKPIEFELKIDENIQHTLIGDEIRIKQILNNLLSNAFKYTNNGKVTLSVQTEQNINDATLVLSVSDTGPGMTTEQINKLFDEYTRFDFKNNSPVEGTGLGMNIVWNLIRIMNGNITINSEINKGTEFIVTIPQKTPDTLDKNAKNELQKNRLKKLEERKPFIHSSIAQGRVLIVDDVESNLYVAKKLLSVYNNLSIETAINGEEVIEKIKNGEIYDIIFMDYMMPKIDGIGVTKILRDLGYTKPIIALTANAIVGQSEIFLKNNFNGFISKPINIKKLDEELTKFIGNKVTNNLLLEELSINKTFETDLEWLVLFKKDAKNAIQVFENTLKNIDTLTDEDIKTFTISAHAMKNTLSNMGKNMLSQIAFTLENAGKESDKKTITEQTQSLIDALIKITSNIES